MLAHFINKPDSSRHLIISSLETINVVVPDPNILWWIAVPIADATGGPNGIKTLLANGLRTFPIKGNAVFSNGSKGLPKNLLDCPIWCNWVFDNFILAEELLVKALRGFETFNVY